MNMDEKGQPEIHFRSYNPYEPRFPFQRVVSRDTLHLIKRLREQNYRVIVEPDDGSKLCYLAQKGVRELLSDPIIMLVIGIPISIAANLVSSWLYDHLKQKPLENDVDIAIEIDESGRKLHYSHTGSSISDERFNRLVAALEKRAIDYHRAFTLPPPDLEYAIPIHLEHTGKVVAWCKSFSHDDKGIWLDNVKVQDDRTWERICCGELRGISIAGIITRSVCQICHRDYVECNHITGQTYNGKQCSVWVASIRMAEVSLVKEPVNPQAIIQLLAEGRG